MAEADESDDRTGEQKRGHDSGTDGDRLDVVQRRVYVGRAGLTHRAQMVVQPGKAGERRSIVDFHCLIDLGSSFTSLDHPLGHVGRRFVALDHRSDRLQRLRLIGVDTDAQIGRERSLRRLGVCAHGLEPPCIAPQNQILEIVDHSTITERLAQFGDQVGFGCGMIFELGPGRGDTRRSA